MPQAVRGDRHLRGPPAERRGRDRARRRDRRQGGLQVGDEVTVATSAPKRPSSSWASPPSARRGLGGATVVVFDLPTAQALFDKRGKVDFAFVAGRDGVARPPSSARSPSLLPPSAQVRTAAQEADKLGDDIREGLSFLTTGLLAFAFIAVLVGAFLIFNTFSITVAQRSRELALLRTLGATGARCSTR